MKIISATGARANFADLLRRVSGDKERIVIERRGRSAVAVIPIEDLEAIAGPTSDGRGGRETAPGRARDEPENRITEREAVPATANEALPHPEARLAGILDIMHEAVISVDEHHRIQLFNKGAEAAFGYSSNEIIGPP